MVLDGFMQFVVGLVNTPLTTAVVISIDARRGRKGQKANQRCGERLKDEGLLSRPDQVATGDRIVTRFASGELRSRVERVEEG